MPIYTGKGKINILGDGALKTNRLWYYSLNKPGSQDLFKK